MRNGYEILIVSSTNIDFIFPFFIQSYYDRTDVVGFTKINNISADFMKLVFYPTLYGIK